MSEKTSAQPPLILPNKRRKSQNKGWANKKKSKHRGRSNTTLKTMKSEKQDASVNREPTIIPSKRKNRSYQDYLKLMIRSDEGPLIGCRILSNACHYRPPSLRPLRDLKKQTIPVSIMTKMEKGIVMETDLHMLAVSHRGSQPRERNSPRQDKYSLYNNEDNCIKVRVKFCCLEDVLLPYDEKEDKTPPSHLVGVVPLKVNIRPGRYRSVNDDVNLYGYEYCLDSFGARYF